MTKTDRHFVECFGIMDSFWMGRYRLHKRELDSIRDPERRHRRLVELNVIEQCLNLFKTGAVQRSLVQTKVGGSAYTTPRIHACVFDPKTGDMKRLKVSNGLDSAFSCLKYPLFRR